MIACLEAACWWVPDEADHQRVIVTCVPSGTSLRALEPCLAAARGSVLWVETAPSSSVDATIDAVNRLNADGCDPAALAVVGLGVCAAAPLAACLLLRMEGRPLPGLVIAAGRTATFVQPPSCPTESIVRHLAVLGVCGRDVDIVSSARLVAPEIDRILSASRS